MRGATREIAQLHHGGVIDLKVKGEPISQNPLKTTEKKNSLVLVERYLRDVLEAGDHKHDHFHMVVGGRVHRAVVASA